MANEIDLTKTAKDFKESLEHLKDDVTEASRGLKPEWRKMLGNMKDFNAPLAKSIAEIRQTSKDTFAGMLGARKFKGITKELKKFADNAGDINPDELKKLQKFTDDIDDFDLTEFQNAQTIVNDIVEENKKLADGQKQSIEMSLAGDKELNRLKSEAKYFQEEMVKAGNAQDREQMDTLSELKLLNVLEQKKLEEELTDAVKKTVIEKKQLNLDSIKDETELRDKYNELLKKPLEDAAEGGDIMTKTFDGIKHLTGGLLDISGFMDDAVQGYQAVTDVATGIQKGANKAFKWLGMIFQGAWLKTVKDWIIKTAAYTKLMKVVQKLRAISFKGWIAGQWQNLKDWVRESTMMKAFNKVRAFSFKAWIATQWANLKQTKLFTVMQSLINKASWATFSAWIAAKWAEVTLMIRQTAQRIAMIAKEIVVWAARMIAKALELATMLLPVLPIIAIAAAVLALAALLIWGGMQLYEKSELFRAMVDTVIGYFKDIVSIIGDIFGGFMDFFTGLFTGDFDLMFSGLSDIFGGLWDLILAPFRAISGFIKDTFGIDIGGWLTSMLRKWLPGWALNLLGMGGSEDTDAMQAGLVGEVEKADKKAGLKSAEESGLMVDTWGQNEVDRSKIADATDQELKAIIADNDISDEDRSLILDQLNQRQIEAGGPDVSAQIAAAREEGLSGADLAERTAQIKAGEYKGGGDTVNATQTTGVDASTTNHLNVGNNARETDPTLARLSTVPATP